ncbi:hypothetical protein ACR79M_12295 [Sphingobacterium spiritivorum]
MTILLVETPTDAATAFAGIRTGKTIETQAIPGWLKIIHILK